MFADTSPTTVHPQKSDESRACDRLHFICKTHLYKTVTTGESTSEECNQDRNGLRRRRYPLVNDAPIDVVQDYC